MTPTTISNTEGSRPETGARLTLDLGAMMASGGGSEVRMSHTVTHLTMVYIRAGTFLMGSPENELGRDNDEGPQTLVTLSRDFWLGETAVTQGQYRAVMGTNPSHFKGAPNLPVEMVSWKDAMEYCRRVTERLGNAGSGVASRSGGGLGAGSGLAFTLPTEAQWEYACRAGTTTRYSFGDDEKGLADHAWFEGNSDGKPHPVKTRQPNPWGLYDLHGNVWEWCSDWFDGKLPGGSVTDWTGPPSGSFRALRGGCWGLSPRYCRSAYRYGYPPGFRYHDLGFRLAAPVQESS